MDDLKDKRAIKDLRCRGDGSDRYIAENLNALTFLERTRRAISIIWNCGVFVLIPMSQCMEGYLKLVIITIGVCVIVSDVLLAYRARMYWQLLLVLLQVFLLVNVAVFPPCEL